MANYRKSFNFRSGVQVDTDNFVVTPLGLVGIGTTIPTELLDVRGTAIVTGLLTSTNLYVSGISTLSGVTISSGVVTAGVITASYFYGDGSNLVNIPTSQWVDTDVGLGFTSIYAIGNVGIATTSPYYSLQVGSDPSVSGQYGIGINSTGDIYSSGIITATGFAGDGSSITSLSASNISSGTISTNRLPVIPNSKLPNDINISGIVTASSVIGSFTGNLTGVASSAYSLTGTPNINVGILTASSIESSSSLTGSSLTLTSTLTASSANIPSIVSNFVNAGFVTTGISTVYSTLHVGSNGTGLTLLSSGKTGIGTTNPTSELQIRKDSGSLLEVLSDSGQSRISIGQSIGVGNSSSVLRFGNTEKTFDIINNDTGNINMYLHNGDVGFGTGRFDWIYGQTNAELMSLTYGGKLGIGKTNPDTNLHVVGTSTVTGNAWFGGNVTISGSISAGTFSLPSVIADTNLNVTSGISTVFTINTINDAIVDGQIGIGSTNPITDLDAQGKTALFGTIGINTAVAKCALDVNGTLLVEAIGIGSTSATGLGYQAISIYDRTVGVEDTAITILNTSLVLDNEVLIGIGTTVARSALDFADAGKGYPTQPFLIPPRLTNAERAGLSTVAGAFIFNTDTSKFQGYTGIAWTDFH